VLGPHDVARIEPDVERRTYRDPAGMGVELSSIERGDHTWPGSAIDRPGTTQTIAARELALDWFAAHPVDAVVAWRRRGGAPGERRPAVAAARRRPVDRRADRTGPSAHEHRDVLDVVVRHRLTVPALLDRLRGA
jgi:hypothetical protein